jgi:hypothetical protein
VSNAAKATTLAALALATALLAAGCGGGGGSSTQALTSPHQRLEERAEAEAPKGASPLLRRIYRTFPPPKADPKVKGSAKAIKKGEDACRGMSPQQVKERFISQSKLLPEQRQIVAKLAHYESLPPTSDFVAGQLAALIYEGTISAKTLAGYGYRGCIHSLARSLEHRLAPR